MKTILFFLLSGASQLIHQHNDPLTIDQNDSLQLHHDVAASAAINAYDLPKGNHDHASRKLLPISTPVWEYENYALQNLTNKLKVPTTNQGDQQNTDVNVLKNEEKFVVYTWLSYHFNGTNNESVPSTMMQVLNKTGDPVSAEIQVNPNTQTTAGLSPILPLEGGDFILLWNGKDDIQHNIYGKRFASNGTPKGNLFILSNTSSILETTIPYGVCEGNLCVGTWHTSSFDIEKQRFDINGTLIGNKKTVNVNTSDARYAKVFFVSPTKYAISWLSARNFSANSGHNIHLQLFHQNGTRLLASDVQLNNGTYPLPSYWHFAVDSLNGDRGIVGWQATNPNTNVSSIFYQIVDHDAQLLKQVEEEVNPGNSNATKLFIDIAVSRDDNIYVITWVLQSQTLSFSSIRGQFFQENTTPIGAEVLFIYEPQGSVSRPNIAISAGCIPIGWESLEDLNNTYGIYAKIFNLINFTQAPTSSPIAPTPGSSTTPSPTTKLHGWWQKVRKKFKEPLVIGITLSSVGVCFMITGIGCCIKSRIKSNAVARNLRTANIELALTNDN